MAQTNSASWRPHTSAECCPFSIPTSAAGWCLHWVPGSVTVRLPPYRGANRNVTPVTCPNRNRNVTRTVTRNLMKIAIQMAGKLSATRDWKVDLTAPGSASGLGPISTARCARVHGNASCRAAHGRLARWCYPRLVHKPASVDRRSVRRAALAVAELVRHERPGGFVWAQSLPIRFPKQIDALKRKMRVVSTRFRFRPLVSGT